MDIRAERRAKAEIKVRITLLMLIVISMQNTTEAEQGIFFSKKKYVSRPVPVFETTRDKLPRPVFEENSDSSGVRLVTVKSDGSFDLTIKSGDMVKTIQAPANKNIQIRF